MRARHRLSTSHAFDSDKASPASASRRTATRPSSPFSPKSVIGVTCAPRLRTASRRSPRWAPATSPASAPRPVPGRAGRRLALQEPGRAQHRRARLERVAAFQRVSLAAHHRPENIRARSVKRRRHALPVVEARLHVPRAGRGAVRGMRRGVHVRRHEPFPETSRARVDVRRLVVLLRGGESSVGGAKQRAASPGARARASGRPSGALAATRGFFSGSNRNAFADRVSRAAVGRCLATAACAIARGKELAAGDAATASVRPDTSSSSAVSSSSTSEGSTSESRSERSGNGRTSSSSSSSPSPATSHTSSSFRSSPCPSRVRDSSSSLSPGTGDVMTSAEKKRGRTTNASFQIRKRRRPSRVTVACLAAKRNALACTRGVLRAHQRSTERSVPASLVGGLPARARETLERPPVSRG